MYTFVQKQDPALQTRSVSPASLGRGFLGHGREIRSIPHLQSTAKSQAAQRQIQPHRESLETGSSSTAATRFSHDFSRIAMRPAVPAIQTKLTVNKPGDKYEQEADRVAEAVMRMPDTTLNPGTPTSPATPLIQGKMTGGNTGIRQVPPIVHEVLSSPGQPLNAVTRAFFEPRFGYDFSKVRVHFGSETAESAEAINAQAYTIGKDVVFGRGRYESGRITERGLVAHELTHVVQQGGAGLTSDSVLHRGTKDKQKDEMTPESQRAEVIRLEEELKILTASNRYSGADYTYERIEIMGVESFEMALNPFQAHRNGASAAKAIGDFEQYRIRLWRAKTSLDTAIGEINEPALRDVIAELSNIEGSYGAVRIAPRSESKSEGKKAISLRPELVTVQVEGLAEPGTRLSIEFAAMQIKDTGYFEGLIPEGVYMLGGESFTVIKGTKITDSNIPTVLWGE